MANFLQTRSTALLAATLAGSLLGIAAAAQAPREAQKIVLDAVPVSINYRDNTAVFKEVVITQGDIRIQANEAHVKGGIDFENGQWTISGEVRIKAAEAGTILSQYLAGVERLDAYLDTLLTQEGPL